MTDPGLKEFPYNRYKALEYAHYWAYRRNERFYNFHDIGGDCTNFVSQCLYAGSGVMNYKPTFGWYYVSIDNRAPAWTGVQALYQFLTTNQGVGPYATETEASEMQVGDVIQLSFNPPDFQHSMVVVSTGDSPAVENILIATHSMDADCRPILTYNFQNIRFLHVEGVRAWEQPDVTYQQVSR